VLSLRAGTDYETLLRTRITGPLGMKDTGIALSPALKARLSPGHDAKLAKVANWEAGNSALLGAYAVRSTANDMLTFLAANLGLIQNPLAPAMAAMLAVHRPTDSPDESIGLAWLTRTKPAPEIVWHNGGAGGYRAWVGFDPKARVGVVALSNTFTGAGVDDIDFHLLDPATPALTAAGLTPKEHKQIAVDPKLFDGYVGRYQMAPNFILTISRNGDRLFAQATGQGRFEIFPEGEKDFFAKIADIQIAFMYGVPSG
jgi:CubicO group peptidase (beta-lactamase class C family)